MNRAAIAPEVVRGEPQSGELKAMGDEIEQRLEMRAPILARIGDDAHARIVARHSIAVVGGKLVEMFREGSVDAAALSR
jgi:hypothetical protein